MEDNKLNYFEKIEIPKHRDFIIAQNNCVLCGTVLELRHLVNLDEGQVKEEAYCPCCEIRTRNKNHTVH